jgi:hypothetical protein
MQKVDFYYNAMENNNVGTGPIIWQAGEWTCVRFVFLDFGLCLGSYMIAGIEAQPEEI